MRTMTRLKGEVWPLNFVVVDVYKNVDNTSDEKDRGDWSNHPIRCVTDYYWNWKYWSTRVES
jgi:hypothetical protein